MICSIHQAHNTLYVVSSTLWTHLYVSLKPCPLVYIKQCLSCLTHNIAWLILLSCSLLEDWSPRSKSRSNNSPVLINWSQAFLVLSSLGRLSPRSMSKNNNPPSPVKYFQTLPLFSSLGWSPRSSSLGRLSSRSKSISCNHPAPVKWSRAPPVL